MNTAYAAGAEFGNGISGLGNEAVTVTDTTALAAALVTLDGNTAGVIDVSAVNTLSGSVDDANSVYASNGFTGLGAESVTLSDTSLADVATLNTLNGYTTGNINAGVANLSSTSTIGNLTSVSYTHLTLPTICSV